MRSQVRRIKAQQNQQESWPLNFTKITPKQSWKVVVTLKTEENNNLNLNIVITWHFVFWGRQKNHQPLEDLSSPIYPPFPQYANNFHFHFTEESTKTQKYQVFNPWIKNRFQRWKQDVSERLEPRHPLSPFCTRSPISSTESGRPSFHQLLHSCWSVYTHKPHYPLPTSCAWDRAPAQLQGAPFIQIQGKLCLWVVKGCVSGLFLWDRAGRLFSPKWSVPILTPNSPSYKRVKQNIHTLLKSTALHIWNPVSLSIYSWQVLSPPQISISSSENGIKQ